jgi:hypothetical protein
MSVICCPRIEKRIGGEARNLQKDHGGCGSPKEGKDLTCPRKRGAKGEP